MNIRMHGRDTLRELQRRVVYVSATEASKPRQLLRCILRQLQARLMQHLMLKRWIQENSPQQAQRLNSLTSQGAKRKHGDLTTGGSGASDQTADLLVQLAGATLKHTPEALLHSRRCSISHGCPILRCYFWLAQCQRRQPQSNLVKPFGRGLGKNVWRLTERRAVPP